MVSVKNRKHLLIGLVLLVAVGVAGFLLWQNNQDEKSRQAAGETDASIQAEKDSTEEFDDQLQQEGNADSSNSGDAGSDLKTANVILVDVSSTETRGYISNVLEENGTCTVTLTKGAEKVTATSEGFIDVNKTACEPLTYSQLSLGEWTAQLSYSSASAAGTAESRTVNIP